MVTLVLIGPPGAGKTTVGGIVADRLGASFIDSDALVEQRTGRSISEIFIEDGESAFRALEAEAVVDALTGEGVLALGGGAPMQPAVAAALADQPVVFLDVTIGDAAPRIGFDRSRPLLAVNPRATWTRLANDRRPTYHGLARVVVDTGGRTPDEVADAVLEAIGIQA